MISSYRLPLSVSSIALALTLSACQPTAEDNELATAEEITTTDIETPATGDIDPHAGHDMVEDDMMSEDTQTSDMLKDYTKSMTQMHNEMMVGMGYNDPDTAFAKGMLGHHRGAVDMANIELKYGTDASMRQLAQQIVASQQTEIDTMKKWLASHPDAANPKPNTPAMQKAYAEGMDAMHEEMMTGIKDPVPDMAFARGMLPHHIGAVDMAEVQLKYGKDAEMRQLAQEIINAQQSEIELMKNWIAANGSDEKIKRSDETSTDDTSLDNSAKLKE